MLEKIKPLYKHLGVLVFFFLLVLLIFYPLFKGQIMAQHDIKMWMGGAKECIDYRAAHDGDETMWTNSMFGGMPSYLVSTIYPGNMTKFIQKVISLNLPGSSKIAFASLVCFYICLLCFKVRWQWAAFGAIAFTFSTFNMISFAAGHNSKMTAIALMPLLIGGLKLILDKNYYIGAAVFCLGSSLLLGANHPQIAYYGFFILLGFGISYGIIILIEKDYKHLAISIGIALLAGLVGVLPHTSRLWTLAEYGEYSIRGKSELKVAEGDVADGLTKEYVFAYSQGIKENLSLVAPTFFGEGQFKWGEPNSYAIYFGISIIALFILGLSVLPKRDWIWATILAFIGLLLAFGKYMPSLNYWMYEYFPAYNKFRTPNMTLVITQFCIILIASMTVSKMFEENFEFTTKVKNALYTIGGLLALLLIAAFIMNPIGPYDAEIAKQNPGAMGTILSERSSSMTGSVIRSIIFLGLFAVLYVFYRKSTINNKRTIFALLASALLFLDVSLVNNNYFNENNFTEDYGSLIFPSKADRYLLQQKGEFRVLNVTSDPYTNAEPSYFHHSLGGYHPAKLMRYQDIIEKHLSIGNMQVLRMLNTRYVIQEPKKKPADVAALGNGWFVEKVVAVTTPDDEIDFLKNEEFTPETVAVVDESKFKFSQKVFSNKGKIELTKYEANKLDYSITTDKNGLAVFSEIYYPVGWIARLDGKEVDIKRVNYILRALEIPAGNHKLTFEFRPESYYTGEKISYFGSTLVFLMLLGGIGMDLRRKKIM